jgi:G:T-mismatch repair DNA endonuclease (very short patch repair protein)
MIVKQAWIVFIEFPQYLGYNGFTHEFRFVFYPELPAILIDSFQFVIIEHNGCFFHPFKVQVFAVP